MQTEFKKRELTVALLMEDAIAAQEVSEALRSVGIFAHYYRELDEFWLNQIQRSSACERRNACDCLLP